MQRFFKRYLAGALSALILLACSGCGGGGGGSEAAVEMTTVSGAAVKGPIRGALVQVFRLKPDGTKDELLGSAITGTGGSYSVEIPKAKAVAPLLVSVSGRSGAKYTSESKGIEIDFTPAESFNAALDSYEPARKYTVGPLTEAAYQQLQKFLTDSPTSTADARIVGAANARIARLFNVSDILADPAADPSYSGALRIIDQMVEDSKVSGAGNTLQTMNLINQALVDVAKPAYQNYRTALTSAANQVKADATSLAAIVNAVLATAANPPAEPDWSDSTAPESATGLKARAGAETAGTGSVTLSWNAATTTGNNPVAGYQVYRDGNKIASVSSTVYLDQPLALKTGYRYFIVPFDAAGNRSVQSAEVSVTTPDAPNLNVNVGGQLGSDVTTQPFKDITPPSVPANLTAVTTAIDAVKSSVKLTWSAATDAVAVTGYNLYRNGVKIGTASQTTYTDASVTSESAYSYTIIAFDAAGNRSAASTPLSVTPVAPNLGINVGGEVATPKLGL